MYEQAVAARAWLAQNHVLLPLLDDARDQFTTTVRLRAGSRWPGSHRTTARAVNPARLRNRPTPPSS